MPRALFLNEADHAIENDNGNDCHRSQTQSYVELLAQAVKAVTLDFVRNQLGATALNALYLIQVGGSAGAFTVTGTGTVRYGAGMTFVERSVTGAGTCNVGFFGSDPIVGTVKSCYLFTPTSAAGGASAPTASQVPTNATAINNAKLDRVYLAVFMSMASPDYLVQK